MVVFDQQFNSLHVYVRTQSWVKIGIVKHVFYLQSLEGVVYFNLARNIFKASVNEEKKIN